MSAGAWLIWLLLSAAIVTVSVVHYRRRETPGRGRTLLAVLRGLAAAVLLLLLFDPDLPARGAVAAAGTQVLLDASLSMNVPGAEGGTAWAGGVAAARRHAAGRPVLLFGTTVRTVAAGALPDSAPGDARSRLLPALQAAAEAGVRRVIVLSDGRIEDMEAAVRWAPRLGVEIETVDVGTDVENRSIVEASAPAWVDAGQPVPVEIAVAGDAADSIAVIVRQDGRVIGRAAVAPAAAGRLATGTLELRPTTPPGGGWVRLEVALEAGDAVPDDDVRTVYVQVGEEPAGVAVVSLRPDWEPRFLAPVLERALGLPLRGFLRGADQRWVRLGAGLDAGAPVEEAVVRRAADRAQLLVLHGLDAAAPEWARSLAATGRNVLIFPGDGAPGLPLTVGADQAGDWFPAPEIPTSPVAPLLAGVEPAAATPLPAVRAAELPPGAWAPLLATRGRTGGGVPLVAAGQTAGRRWAVALGSGWWQWAFRGGAERRLYLSLWSAMGGWLARERDVAALPAVRPAAMAVPRGLPIPWVTPGIAADSIRITLSGPGGAALDTVVVPARGDTAFSVAPEPGHFSYRARAFDGANVIDAQGLITIERFAPDLARPRADMTRLEQQGAMVRGDIRARRGTPLHSTAIPWVLIVGLLAAEWILRRRWGLR